MSVSTFDLFRIGIGPSSSHTVGPMRACNLFLATLRAGGALTVVNRVCCELYGSLAATGRGHGTDRAVLLGLEGEQPDRVDPRFVEQRAQEIRAEGHLRLAGEYRIAFDESRDLRFHRGEFRGDLVGGPVEESIVLHHEPADVVPHVPSRRPEDVGLQEQLADLGVRHDPRSEPADVRRPAARSVFDRSDTDAGSAGASSLRTARPRVS